MKLSALLDANYRIQVKKSVENMFLTSPHERKRKGYVGGGGVKWPKKKMRFKESRHNVVIHFEGVKELTYKIFKKKFAKVDKHTTTLNEIMN